MDTLVKQTAVKFDVHGSHMMLATTELVTEQKYLVLGGMNSGKVSKL